MKTIFHQKTILLTVVLALVCVTAVGDSTIVKTKWKSGVVFDDSGKATSSYIRVQADDGTGYGDWQDFQVKGVCYSPVPLGTNINYNRWLSDIYWDAVTDDANPLHKGGSFSNYNFLWREGHRDTSVFSDQNNVTSQQLTTMGVNTPANKAFNYREDIKRIADDLKCNSIRVYGFTSRLFQTEYIDSGDPSKGEKIKSLPIPELAIGDYNEANGFTKVTHKEFLDECLANNVYVMVGLFLGANIYNTDPSSTDPGVLTQVHFWTQCYREVIDEVGNHPAVMGFIINNEVDPNPADPTTYTYWWEHAEPVLSYIRNNAPDKLIGFALHESPVLLKDNVTKLSSAVNQNIDPAPPASVKYYNDYFDFWGMNAYIFAKGTLDIEMAAYKESIEQIASNCQYTQDPDKNSPVLYTEWGVPGLHHNEPFTTDEFLKISKFKAGDPSVTSDEVLAVWKKMANVTDELTTDEVNSRLDNVINGCMKPAMSSEYPIWSGMFYFEFCDEYWNDLGATPQVGSDIPGYSAVSQQFFDWYKTFIDDPAMEIFAFNDFVYMSGQPTDTYWWDQMSWGLYPVSVSKLGRVTHSDPSSRDTWATWNWDGGGYNGPYPWWDLLETSQSQRKQIRDALVAIYGKTTTLPGKATISDSGSFGSSASSSANSRTARRAKAEREVDSVNLRDFPYDESLTITADSELSVQIGNQAFAFSGDDLISDKGGKLKYKSTADDDVLVLTIDTNDKTYDFSARKLEFRSVQHSKLGIYIALVVDGVSSGGTTYFTERCKWTFNGRKDGSAIVDGNIDDFKARHAVCQYTYSGDVGGDFSLRMVVDLAISESSPLADGSFELNIGDYEFEIDNDKWEQPNAKKEKYIYKAEDGSLKTTLVLDFAKGRLTLLAVKHDYNGEFDLSSPLVVSAMFPSIDKYVEIELTPTYKIKLSQKK